jgi:ABC-type polysaccharide/polyol phosphate transport system ATPase subunit
MRNGRDHGLAYVVRDLGICFDLEYARPRTLRQTAGSLVRGRLRAESRRPFWAIRNVSLTLRRGQALGVVGSNGSGKSTLLLALAGVLPPDEGSALIFGAPTLLSLGAGFEIELTGRQNIYLNAAYLGLSRRRIERLVPSIVEFSELGDFVDVPIRQYSAGMRARLGFAVATRIRPDILLLDELFSVGDPAFQESSRAELARMIKSSSTIVIVSHDAGFLSKTCSTVAWLDHGALVDYGDADAVLSRYRDRSRMPPERPIRVFQ